MNILVTGATGFIGQHLLDELDYTKDTIHVISRNPDKKTRNGLTKCKIIKADLTDYQSLLSAMKDIDVVINIAAEIRNLDTIEKTNIEGTANLINAAAKNNVSKIIHLSSVGVVGMQYSSTPITITEESECIPKNEYEKTKLTSEKILIENCKASNIILHILRPTNVFGEYHPQKAMSRLILHIAKKKPLLATKNACYNYVYVKDLTGIIAKLISYTGESSIMNVGNSMTIKNTSILIQKELNKNSQFVTAPSFLIKLLQLAGIKKLNPVSNEVIYSDKKLKAIFDYNFGLEKGISNTIQFYKKEGLIK